MVSNDKLIKLHYTELKQIHCLPIKASLNAFGKRHKLLTDDEQKHSDFLLKYSLNPYLKGNDEAYFQQNKSRFYLSDNSLFTDVKSTNNANKKQQRHLMQSEQFISNDIAWIMTCKPSNGCITEKTEIFCHGEAIADLSEISIRAIYESMPQISRNYTPRQIKINYLEPFINGRLPYIDYSQQGEIKIFGASFCVRRSVPFCGLITMRTDIDYMGTAIKRKELANMQQIEDYEMAKQLLQKMKEEKIAQRRMSNRLRTEWSSPIEFNLPNIPWIGNNESMQVKPVQKGVN